MESVVDEWSVAPAYLRPHCIVVAGEHKVCAMWCPQIISVIVFAQSNVRLSRNHIALCAVPISLGYYSSEECSISPFV